jgi:2-amino-4-hydroxy-6-hydroxymethyldihydropteridine diphosphokinase
MTKKAVFLLGSNMGNRMHLISEAIRLLEEKTNASALCSPMYETAPWGNPNQEPFVNCAILINTSLNAQQLLSIALETEQELGRQRNGLANQPRLMDVDLLLLEDEVLNLSQCTVPHPRLHQRQFALVPLADVYPDWLHPVIKKATLELLRDCEDQLSVMPLQTDEQNAL